MLTLLTYVKNYQVAYELGLKGKGSILPSNTYVFDQLILADNMKISLSTTDKNRRRLH